jgi:hypothetical protein
MLGVAQELNSDGAVHDETEQKHRDWLREQCLREFGLRLLRFRNEEVMEGIEKVLGRIVAALYPPYPRPFPTLRPSGSSAAKPARKGKGSLTYSQRFLPRPSRGWGKFPTHCFDSPPPLQ